MFKFQKKPRFKRIIYSPIVLVLLAVVVCFAIYGVIDIIPKYIDAIEVKKNMFEKREVLIERQIHIENELDKLSTGNGVEEAIREKLNVVKENEHVIMIVEPKIQPIDESSQKEKSWWQRLFE